MTRTKEDQMIHVDTVKKVALLALFIFTSWNWAVTENEVRNLTTVGTSIGEGWSQCMVVLKPKVDGLEALASQIIGLAGPGDYPVVSDAPQAGDDE